MKLSIWQQFSSNHSSSFTVVGRFENQSDADSAAAKFREMLRTIHTWLVEHPTWDCLDYDDDLLDDDPYEFGYITPPERAFARQYQVEWERSIDWIGDNPDEQVQQFERDVLISTEFLTEVSAKPIQGLMAKFGGTVFTQEGIDLVVHLTALFPDPSQAQQIVEEAQVFTWDYQDAASKSGQPLLRRDIPWGKDSHLLIGSFKREGSRVIYDGRFFRIPEMLNVINWLKQRDATEVTYTLPEDSDD